MSYPTIGRLQRGESRTQESPPRASTCSAFDPSSIHIFHMFALARFPWLGSLVPICSTRLDQNRVNRGRPVESRPFVPALPAHVDSPPQYNKIHFVPPGEAAHFICGNSQNPMS